jgi:Ca2+-binding RTX toxin-like protein
MSIIKIFGKLPASFMSDFVEDAADPTGAWSAGASSWTFVSPRLGFTYEVTGSGLNLSGSTPTGAFQFIDVFESGTKLGTLESPFLQIEDWISIAGGTGSNLWKVNQLYSGWTDYTGSALDDVIEGMGGNDTLTGLDGNDTFRVGVGNDTMFGGAGEDTADFSGIDGLDFSSSPDFGTSISLEVGLKYNNSAGFSSAFTGQGTSIEHVIGSVFSDLITGSSMGNTLSGLGGSDEIRGLGGDDTLNGGTMKDKLWGDDGFDVLSGGGGADRLFGGTGNDVLSGGKGNDRMLGGKGLDNLFGGSGSDQAFGGAGQDNLQGGAGNDGLFGENGRDNINGGSGADLLDGGGGGDFMLGGGGRDRMLGGLGGDTMDGGSGNDRIFGGAGNDTITGGKGNDTMNGGAGRDVFEFNLDKVTGDDYLVNYNLTKDSLFFTGTLITPISVATTGTDTILTHDGGTVTFTDLIFNLSDITIGF